MFKKLKTIWKAYKNWETYVDTPGAGYSEKLDSVFFRRTTPSEAIDYIKHIPGGRYVRVMLRCDAFHAREDVFEFYVSGINKEYVLFIMELDDVSKTRLFSHLEYEMLMCTGNVSGLRAWLEVEERVAKLQALKE